MSFLTFLDELWRKKENYKDFQKIPKIQNFDPLIFEPLNYEYSDSPCSRAPVYQIWGP